MIRLFLFIYIFFLPLINAYSKNTSQEQLTINKIPSPYYSIGSNILGVNHDVEGTIFDSYNWHGPLFTIWLEKITPHNSSSTHSILLNFFYKRSILSISSYNLDEFTRYFPNETVDLQQSRTLTGVQLSTRTYNLTTLIPFILFALMAIPVPDPQTKIPMSLFSFLRRLASLFA